jgi:hypothetical protein
MLRKSNHILVAALLLALSSGTVLADKPKSPIKKTLDGRCLTPDHPDYWKTNIYIAKPSVESCIASGGQLVASN